MPSLKRSPRRLLVLLLLLAGCRCDRATGAGPQTSAGTRVAPSEVEPPARWLPIEAAHDHDSNPRVIGWEAERPSKTDFPEHHPYEPEDPAQAEVLSDGKWIGTPGQTTSRFLEYDIEVANAASYDFFARKFWSHGPFRWRFDAQPWRECGTEIYLLDTAPLRKHVAANWVELGSVELTTGKHRLRIETLPATSPAVFDAFALSQDDFLPQGRLDVPKVPATSEAGWTRFEPRLDRFDPTPLDLQGLNQTRAGEQGFVTARGSTLHFGEQPEAVRFWGLSAGHDVLLLSPRQMRRYARDLAKHGVNLLRLHGAIFREDAPLQFNEQKLERIQRLTAVLKEHGIYLGLSIYFPVWFHARSADGFAGYDGPPFGLAYFKPEFEAVQKGWWRRLLTTPDTTTGLSLAQDPALAYVELVNEDSLFFWTFRPYETVPAEQMPLLERRFGRWLAGKYGSLGRAFETWASANVRGDDVAEGRAGFLALWELGEQRSERARDTAEFLARVMREHYASLVQLIKTEIGYRGLTVCSNWMTANEHTLGPLDNWANTVCDVMDRHAYYSGPHEGLAAEFSVEPGQRYADSSLLTPASERKEEQANWLPPFIEPRYDDKPAFVSEIGWPWPNRFRSEGPLLTAAYARLTGVDAPFWFTTTAPRWARRLDKFEIKEPATFGQFPAAALIFRRGLVREADPVGRIDLTDHDLFSLGGLPIATVSGVDTFRAKDILKRLFAGSDSSAIDPLQLLRGPIDVRFGAAASAQTLKPAASTPTTNTVQSATDELVWNFDSGVVSIGAPAANAALGFLGKAGPIELPDVRFTITDDYASIALVPLDAETIASSRKLLLQVGSEVKNTGWSAAGTGLREIAATGTGPVLLRDVHGRVELKRSDAAQLRVTALDPNGYPRLRSETGADHIALLPDTLYYLIERAPE